MNASGGGIFSRSEEVFLKYFLSIDFLLRAKLEKNKMKTYTLHALLAIRNYLSLFSTPSIKII